MGSATRDVRFIVFVVAFLIAFYSYAAYQERRHDLAKYAIKCREFGGQVELVPSYSKPLCRKSGALFALD